MLLFIVISCKDTASCIETWRIVVVNVIYVTLDFTAEASSINITFGKQVELVCLTWSSGLLTFIWHELSQGIVRVDIVSSTDKNGLVVDFI